VTIYERALHVMIHDLRSPLGVAQGYLRMLREDRLSTPEARLRAIAQTQQALDRIARLCADAAALAGDAPGETARRVLMPCERLVDRVRERLDRETVAVAASGAAPAGLLAVPPDADRLAEAVAQVLLAGPAAPGRTVAIGATGDEVWFSSGPEPAALSGAAFDCWRGSGFALPLACQAITGAGGRVWAADDTGAGVAFPLEVGR